MKITARVLIASLAAALPVLAQEAGPDPAGAHARAVAALEANPRLAYAPSTLLVKFKAGAAENARAGARVAAQARTVHAYSIVAGLELVETSQPLGQAIAGLKASDAVEYAEPDYVVHAVDVVPNDANFALQWGARNTGQSVNGDPGTAGADARLAAAWGVTTGDPGFVVAMIDTGVQLSHPDLAANIWVNPGEIAGNGIDDDGDGYVDDVNGWNFYDANNNPGDTNGHGTHTAGTVGAVGNNGSGVAGMMWSCKLMALRFIGPTGGYTSDAVLAVQFAANHGVKVSSNSWGGGGSSQALYDAINSARGAGHIFVAAAGNGGSDNIGDNNDAYPFYPASYALDNIISVAATDNDDRRASFSNYGATSVDIGAPGVNILSTWPGGYAYLDGTSMATPHVAGIVGLVYAQNPGWTYAQVRSRVLGTARPVSSLAGITATGGVVDAGAAVGAGTQQPPPQAPAAPGTPAVTRLSGGQLLVSWADNSNNEDGFEVQRERRSGNRWGSLVTVSVGANVTSITDSPGSGTFHYRVRAVNSAGASAWSAWKQIKN